MEPTAATSSTLVADAPAESSSVDLPAGEDTLIEEELLVEEISIDGMCGVY
ncbi:MAG: mycofactocin precursor MftA [Acidimicrobiales bacterium]